MSSLKHPSENLSILADAFGRAFCWKFPWAACKDPSSSLSLLLPLRGALLHGCPPVHGKCWQGIFLMLLPHLTQITVLGVWRGAQPAGGWEQSVLQHKPNLLLPLEISNPAAKALPTPAAAKGRCAYSSPVLSAAGLSMAAPKWCQTGCPLAWPRGMWGITLRQSAAGLAWF